MSIVFRAPHKIITDNARRNKKLPVIQQVGSRPNSIKSDFTCRNVSMFWLANILVLYLMCLFISTHVVYFQQSFLFCVNILIHFRVLLYNPLPLPVPPWPIKQQHIFVMFTSPVIPRQVHTTNVLKITLKIWNEPGMTCTHPGMDSGGHIL